MAEDDRVVQYATWLKDNADQRNTPEFAKVSQAYKTLRLKDISASEEDPSEDPTVKWSKFVSSGEKGSEDLANFGPAEIAAGHPLTRYAIGAARPALAFGQAIGLPTGGKPLTEALTRGAQTQEPGVGEAADIVGQFMSPTNLALGKLMGPVKGVFGAAGQGAVLGGMGGALSEVQDPDEKAFWGTKLEQAGAGMTVGAILGPLLQLGGGAFTHAYRNWIEPVLGNYSQAVRGKVKQRIFLAAADDKKDEVLAALQGARETVPGSPPTAAQAAVPAEATTFSALGESARRVAPNQYAARTDEQSAAALAQLQSVAKSPDELAGMEKARTRATDPLYRTARTDTTQPIWRPWEVTMEGRTHQGTMSPLVEYLDKTIAANPGNRALVQEFKTIRAGLMDPKTGVRTDPGELVSVLDGIKAAMKNEDNKFILKELELVRRRLSARLPRWREAEAAFSEQSKPITQGRIGAELLETSQPPGGWRPGAGRPLEEKKVLELWDNIKKAREVKDLLPEARERIESVAKEFIRNMDLAQQAKLGRASAPDPKAVGTSLPNLLMREAMVMNAILKKFEGKVSQKVAAEIAVEMLNPSKVATSMQRGLRQMQMNKARSEFVQKLYRQNLPATLQVGFQQGQDALQE